MLLKPGDYQSDKKYQLVNDYTTPTDFQPRSAEVSDYITLLPDGALSITNGYAWGIKHTPFTDTHCNTRKLLMHAAINRLGLNYDPGYDLNFEPAGIAKYISKIKHQLVTDIETSVNLKPTEKAEYRFITLHTNGQLQIRKGYCWDGASGLLPDISRYMSGSLVHDALYELLRQGTFPSSEVSHWQQLADQELRRIFRQDASRFEAAIIYRLARMMSGTPWNAADPKAKRKIQVSS